MLFGTGDRDAFAEGDEAGRPLGADELIEL